MYFTATTPTAAPEPEYWILLATWGSPVVVAIATTWLAHRFTFRRELERARQERLSMAAKGVIEEAAAYIWAYSRFVNNLSAYFHFMARLEAGDVGEAEARGHIEQADEGSAEALDDLEKHEQVMRTLIAGLKLYAPPEVYGPLESLMETTYRALASTQEESENPGNHDEIIRGARVDLQDALDKATDEVRLALAPSRKRRLWGRKPSDESEAPPSTDQSDETDKH